MGGGEIEPLLRLDGVLRDTLAAVVQQPQEELRGRLALFGGAVKPARGFLITRRHAESVLVLVAKKALRVCRARTGFDKQ